MSNLDMVGQRIDRNAVHRVLHRRTDRHGRVTVTARQLADELGVSYWNFTLILNAMTEEGRLRQIGGGPGVPKTYVVLDPQDWDSHAIAG